ncbi:alpha-N-acetylgalactosamine-specific lectin-like [Mytilus trossulus]|uniref:alpha-N-acetylgalactosamine-specific lectin-like n=1 Tax=Mytilus trossulus TaxID=6551 RepID=UPI0030055136
MVIYFLKNLRNKFCNLFTLLWIISESDLIYTSEVREMIWTQDETYNNLTLSTGFVWQKTVRSRLKCSVTCTDDERCGAFFFSDADKSCLATPFLLKTTEEGITVIGTEYYFFRPANCPDDHTYNRKTNLCVKMYNDILNFDAAKSKCESIANGGLVTIRNQNQHAFIVQELNKQNLSEHFYIDGTDKAEEGKFIGKDGKEITYLDWGFVSQLDGLEAFEDCLSLNPAEDYKYEDTDCGKEQRYICEVVSN